MISNPYLSAILKKAAEFCSAAFLRFVTEILHTNDPLERVILIIQKASAPNRV